MTFTIASGSGNKAWPLYKVCLGISVTLDELDGFDL